MARDLFTHMLTVAERLREQFPTRKLGRGRIIYATDADGLTEIERAEAERFGKERIAKQVLDALETDLLKRFGAEGGMAMSQPDVDELQWKVRQLDRAIADLTRQRARYVALIEAAKEAN